MQIAEAFDGAVYIFLVVVRNPSGTRHRTVEERVMHEVVKHFFTDLAMGCDKAVPVIFNTK